MIRFNEWLLPALEQRLEEALRQLASDMRKLFSMLSVHETRRPAFGLELPVVASGTLVPALADAPRLLLK